MKERHLQFAGLVMEVGVTLTRIRGEAVALPGKDPDINVWEYYEHWKKQLDEPFLKFKGQTPGQEHAASEMQFSALHTLLYFVDKVVQRIEELKKKKAPP